MDNIKKDAHYLKGDGEGSWGDSLALFSSVSHSMTWVKMVHLIFRWQTAGRNGEYVGRSKKDRQSDTKRWIRQDETEYRDTFKDTVRASGSQMPSAQGQDGEATT